MVKGLLKLLLFLLCFFNSYEPVHGDEIEIKWFINVDGYESVSASVGDELKFIWGGFHNVHIHPSGTCDKTDSEFVGSSSPASYTITERDVGGLFFACQISSHCGLGQFLQVDVEASNTPLPSTMPTSSPSSIPSSYPSLGSTSRASPTNPPTIRGPTNPPTTSFSYAELVRNYQFEKTNGWKLKPGDSAANAVYDCESDNSYKGVCAMKFSPGSMEESSMRLKAKLKKGITGNDGDLFVVSYYVKGVNNEKRSIKATVKFFDEDKKKVASSSCPSKLVGNHEYMKVECMLTVPSDYASVNLFMHYESSNAEVWIDSVSLNRISPPL